MIKKIERIMAFIEKENLSSISKLKKVTQISEETRCPFTGRPGVRGYFIFYQESTKINEDLFFRKSKDTIKLVKKFSLNLIARSKYSIKFDKGEGNDFYKSLKIYDL